MHRAPSSRLTAPAAAALAAALAGSALAAAPATASAEAPSVTEIHYDNVSTDTGEAVEVSAAPGTDLDGWSLVLYNGSGGALYDTVELTGTVGDAGAVTVEFPTNGIQNGAPDGLALVAPDGTVVELLSYEGAFTALGGPAAGMTTTDIGVAESGDTRVGQSLQRVDGTWTGPAPETFVRADVEPEPEPGGPDCGSAATTTIAQVQGSGDETPLGGQDVTVEGVVVADLQDGGYDGFHLQSQEPDGDPATSEAVFVYAPGGPDVALGDVVQVVGEAGEFRGVTQIRLDALDTCATGAALPTAEELVIPADEQRRESLEGMRVRLGGDDLTVSEVYNLNRFGEVVLSSGGILLIPTEVAQPGPAADAVRASNAQRRIVLDDGRTTNLATAGTAPPYLELEDPVRVGDRVARLEEDLVLSYGFDAWRLQPADGSISSDTVTFAPTNPRQERPDRVEGRVKVASFNVLNYFTTLEVAPNGREPRGASTPEELARQEAKIVAAINRLGADVVALQEIENSAALGEETDEALATLVDALNAAVRGRPWAYVPSPDNLPSAEEQDVITNAIIYRRGRVSPWRESVALTDAPGTPEAEQDWDNAREPLAQTFVARGDRFTGVANHFKSKSPGGATGDNLDTGQGAYNADRVGQAEAVAGFVDDLARRARDTDVLVLGDLNAYTQEDPIDVLRDAGLVDLGERFAPGEYSYVFSGESGSLDHALATRSMLRKVQDLDIWSINAVESYAYQYDGFPGLYDDDPFRASDHDPLVLGFDPRPPHGGYGRRG